MDKEKLEKQYDRFISQLREEVSQLFLIHGFFFALNTALLGFLFSNDQGWYLLPMVKIVGLLLVVYWFLVIQKKNRWREDWLSRIKCLEKELEFDCKHRMFTDAPWKGGLSALFFFVPVAAFFLIWLLFPASYLFI